MSQAPPPRHSAPLDSAVDGIAGRIGGHSLRVGSARELATEGSSVAELQQAGGWKSPTTPGGYIRREAAAHGPLSATSEQGGKVRRCLSKGVNRTGCLR